ncbi:MAG: FAD-dependent oxidoreductase [Chloroflexota bacterium]|nr:MAG: FAD-dependent oxidoreductase [Chloroflexota bacterium]
MEGQFKYLFSPLKIGPVTVPNRLLSTSHHTMMIDPRSTDTGTGPGFMGERYAHYLGDKAKGGTGLVYAGQTAVHPTTEWECFNVMKSYDEKAIPGMQLVTDMIHKNGAVTFMQLFHTGAYHAIPIGGIWPRELFSVSGLSTLAGCEIAKVMEQEDIDELVEYYGRSAANGKAGGFDGIEVHSSHGYLPQQFLSPLTNHRTDKYGGSLDNRMRFLLEVLERCRKELGSGTALGVRLCGDEMVPGGLTAADFREVAQKLEASGLIDFINVSLSNAFFNLVPCIAPMYLPGGYGTYAASNIREVVKLPVFTIGRITDPVQAEQILAEGHADIVGMTRAIIADPELGNKAREGRLDEIRNCTGCVQYCLGHQIMGVTTGCTQNPTANREKYWGIGTIQPATKKKKVLIAGGGPAGMEAAWVAAARGHQVTLYEKTDELGGQVKLSRKLAGREDSDNWARWRIQQMKRYPNIKVVLNQELTPSLVEQEKPDAVLIATGSAPSVNRPSEVWGPTAMPGWDQDNVVTPEDILSGRVDAGNKVIVMDYVGTIKALAMADTLALQGKKVEFVCLHLFPAARHEPINQTFARARAAGNGVTFSPTSHISKVSGRSVTIAEHYSGKERTEENVDTVVVAFHGVPNDDLYFALKGKVPELHRIGDCLAARDTGEAIYEGHKVGREL